MIVQRTERTPIAWGRVCYRTWTWARSNVSAPRAFIALFLLATIDHVYLILLPIENNPFFAFTTSLVIDVSLAYATYVATRQIAANGLRWVGALWSIYLISMSYFFNSTFYLSQQGLKTFAWLPENSRWAAALFVASLFPASLMFAGIIEALHSGGGMTVKLDTVRTENTTLSRALETLRTELAALTEQQTAQAAAHAQALEEARTAVATAQEQWKAYHDAQAAQWASERAELSMLLNAAQQELKAERQKRTVAPIQLAAKRTPAPDNYAQAIKDVQGGMSLSAAATKHNVRRQTLTERVNAAQSERVG